MSMPRSVIAAVAQGLISMPGSLPPDQAIAWSGGQVGEETQGHLGAAGVVGAQEQHDRAAVAVVSLDSGEGP
ncbi:hypothetical protein [Micromonospora chersina]|uniref:hypothetical protein n=1 Tax=Micromonospora chersina TaxID=47854 RepID=UPI00367896D3